MNNNNLKRKGTVAEKSEIPSFKDVKPLARRNFDKMVKERHKLNSQIKRWEGRKKEVDDDIGALLELVELKSARVGNLTATLCHGKNSSISKVKLVELGVDLDDIIEATTITEYDYVQVKESTKK